MSRKTGPSKVQADIVIARAGGLCEAIFEEECEGKVVSECNGQPVQLHHRRPRGAGGTRRPDANSPANLLHICLPCHVAIESFRLVALRRGLLVSQHSSEPVSCVGVWRRGVWVLLTDAGGVVEQTVPF